MFLKFNLLPKITPSKYQSSVRSDIFRVMVMISKNNTFHKKQNRPRYHMSEKNVRNGVRSNAFNQF